MANRGIDDVYRRINAKDSYKKRKFGDKKSVTDDYTSERIFYGNDENAIHKHPMEKTADIDHVTPIAVVKERYGNLTVEQQRKLANNEKYNYAMTNSELNRNSRTGKNALENHEYLAKKIGEVIDTAKSGDLAGTVDGVKDLSKKSGRMLAAEGKSRTGMAIEATGMRIENTVERVKHNMQQVSQNASVTKERFVDGSTTAIEGSAIPLLVESVHNLYLVANGEKELDEAAKDMGKYTIDVGIAGGIMQIISTGVNNKLKDSKKKVLQKLANSNQISQVISVSLLIKDALVKYINGEIDGKGFFNEIGEKGVGLFSSGFGAVAGQALIPIPVVGAFIGSIVISTVSCGIYKEYISINEYTQKIEKVNHIAEQALKEMEIQRNNIEEIIKQQFGEWDNQFCLGFNQIFDAIMQDHVEEIFLGLDRILSVFGENVKFKTFEEFDEFFMDEDATFSF